MNTLKKKIVKWALILLVSGTVIGGGAVFYMFNMPHRNVQAASADFELGAKQLVNEYLRDAQAANDKYLQENGESKIIAVTGIVASVDEDMKRQKVVLLKESGEKAGVSCTFMLATNANAKNLKKGNEVTIKGVIRSGAGYDADLELYEDVILEKSDVVYN